jgi:hypothetical protein
MSGSNNQVLQGPKIPCGDFRQLEKNWLSFVRRESLPPTIQTLNTPGLPVAPEKSGQSDSDKVDIPTIGLRCSMAEMPAPPALSYMADNLRDLIHDWDSGTRLQIKGAYVPLKYWSQVYEKHRGDIYSKRREIWRQWRVS